MTEQTQKKPNILVIWGDDIGQSNLSCYSHGLIRYRTPNIAQHRQGRHVASPTATVSSPAPPGARPSSLGRASIAPGCPRSVSRRPGRHVGEDRHHRGAAQRAGLRHRAVRQEPPRRPKPHVAHQSRLRRVLRNLYHLHAEEEPEMYNYPKKEQFPHFRENHAWICVIRACTKPSSHLASRNPSSQPNRRAYSAAVAWARRQRLAIKYHVSHCP